MQVAIIGGGLATRLGKLVRERPKTMLEIRGKPFLEYQLDFLRRGGISDFILCLGHMGEQIERYFGDGSRYGVSIKYSFEKSGAIA
jgi:NDP-sugar pyrophosphorylase family protein